MMELALMQENVQARHENLLRTFFVFAWIIAFAPPLMGQPSGIAGIDLFETRIRPVLAEHCYSCHSGQAAKKGKLKGELRLDSRAGLLQGGASGPIFVAGKPDESLLIKALRHQGDVQMPPKGKLAAPIVRDFEAWIRMGAPAPADTHKLLGKEIDWNEARKFWAFQSPVKRPLPNLKNAAWPRRDIDYFILAELEKRQLAPVGPANRRDLLRRASFGLTGLPPTPEEIDEFLKDEDPNAFAKVVERLLTSPHYGERWGRYWLDVARYAEDKALAFVNSRPHAYRYRDWVVQALNDDMPYDVFIRLQLAGDLMPTPDVSSHGRVAGDERAEPTLDTRLFLQFAGLGFQGLGAEYHRGNVAAQVMADELDDRVDTVTRGLLGLTVACARCHDHKYDPIPTRDYYSLAAAYNGSELVERPLADPTIVERFKAWEKKTKEKEALVKSLDKQRKGGKVTEAAQKEYDARKQELDVLRKEAPPPLPMAHVIRGGGTAMNVLIRGNVQRKGEAAPPGFLHVLPTDSTSRTESGKFTRLELAEAIASPRNPMTARVLVNRVWAYHFCRGLVATPSNFGALGDRPSHPELLDTLAVRFMENGWSLRWLHREIMLSTTYQLSSRSEPASADKDPDNQYLWRHTPSRLDFEAWRDAWLAVSGRLDPKLGGPSLDLNQSTNVRRTLYAKISRHEPNKLMVLFDFPDPNVSSARRSITTVPQQQLFALNSAFSADTARAFAKRLEMAAFQEDERIRLAFQLAYGRVPSAEEKRASEEFLRTAGAVNTHERLNAWEQFAQSLLAANEFMWVD
jgi:hypothetical protein